MVNVHNLSILKHAGDCHGITAVTVKHRPIHILGILNGAVVSFPCRTLALTICVQQIVCCSHDLSKLSSKITFLCVIKSIVYFNGDSWCIIL